MQTFEQIVEAALARLAEFTSWYPHGRQVAYRRVGIRQQELYAIAAHVSPEYSGECALADVTDGAVDFDDIALPVDTPERITTILVYELDPGYVAPEDGSPVLAVGDEISVVPIADPDSGVFPRATLRRGVLRGYAGELDEVTRIEVYYPYRPEPADSDEDGTREVEVPDPHSELLVVDLAREYLQKAQGLDDKSRAGAIALLDREEERRLEAWVQHVTQYAPTQSRFGRPPQAEQK